MTLLLDDHLLRDWMVGPDRERQAIIASLVALPEDFVIVRMRELAWRMGVLITEHSGLSTLGSEALAAAEVLHASLLVSARDDSPGIRRACRSRHVGYRTQPR